MLDDLNDRGLLVTCVLHYDGDFDMIRGITGQSMRRVVDPGAADRWVRGARPSWP